MIRVVLKKFSEPDPVPTWFDNDVRAVPAASYAALDEGQGGVTRADIRTDDIVTLDRFAAGDDVFVESEDAQDVLDDTDVATEVETRIWWRATVVER